MTTRTALRRDLADLKQKVYFLGEKCLELSDLYNLLLENYSEKMSEKLFNISDDIKNTSKELNDQCFLVLTLQQPLIRDLRFVIGSLQIVLSLEKISEQFLSSQELLTNITIFKTGIKGNVVRMANLIHDLLQNSLTFYLSLNSETNISTNKIVTEISFLHNLLYKEILKELGKDSGEKVQVEAQLLSNIRSVEKISDLALNINEQVNYIIIGKSA